ncbi:MAG: hypothetical protein Q7R54_03405, partial [bacterium]|nr:hypothetical protein [bacterium]
MLTPTPKKTLCAWNTRWKPKIQGGTLGINSSRFHLVFSVSTLYASNFVRGKRGAALIITIFFFIAISVAIIQSATIGAIAQLRTYRALAESKYAYV